jgi:hypothetical protein
MPHDPPEPTSTLEADVARIESMRAAGTITPEEADRLIEVLREIAAAERDIEAIGEPPAPAPASEPARPLEPTPASAPEPAPEPTPARPPEGAPMPEPGPSEPAAGPQRAAEARAWIEVAIIAGDIRIQGGDVDEPVLRSDGDAVVMERHGDGWRVRDVREDWFGRFAGADVDVTVPRALGVKLDVKAGDVRIRDVAAVSGRIMAGDLEIDGVEAIDLHKSAGDLSARVRLTHGRHRIRASAGDVKVTLLRGSDVAVRASVTMGDIHGPADFERVRSGLGGTLDGRVGAGRAELEVRLSAGDVRIEKEADHG